MIISYVVLVTIAGIVIYSVIFSLSKFFGDSRTFRLQMLIVVVAGLLGTLLLLLLGNQHSPLEALVLIGIIVLAICATLLVIVLQLRKVNKGKEDNRNRP